MDKTVTGCRTCPMAASVDVMEGASVQKCVARLNCQHPQGQLVDVKRGAPSWCPLHEEPITIRLRAAKEGS